MDTAEIVDFKDLDARAQDLIRASVAVREHSYSPYSKFKVGAALSCRDGTISTGCNVENASYPIGICAERSAIVKAVSEGKQDFDAVAIVADLDDAPYTSPCGACRQMFAEFGDITVYLSRTDMKRILKTRTKDLLPLAFGMKNDK